MAFNWTDISNNEVANSVRTKLNALGTSYANNSEVIDNLDTQVNGVVSDITTINGKLQTLNSMMSISTNVSCPVAQWTTDSAKTYEDYPYKADLYIQGVTSDMIPLVNFAATEQVNGNFVGSESATNIVTIWAKEIPSGDFTIPNIVLMKGVDING